MTERTWKRGIALDFDGVIHDYSGGWTGHVPEGGPVPGALEFVQEMLAQGWEVSIFTCRALPENETPDSPWAKHAERIGAVREWLVRYGFPGEVILTGHKPHAEIYVDDRAFRFQGCWNAVRAALDVKPWQHPEAVKPTPAPEASLKMDLATAVAVLNREKHRHNEDWQTDGVFVSSHDRYDTLEAFEVVAIATAYEQDRLAKEPIGEGSLGEKIRSHAEQCINQNAEGMSEENQIAYRKTMAQVTEAIIEFLESVEKGYADSVRSALIQELEALGNSTLGLDVAIEKRLAELRSQDGA